MTSYKKEDNVFTRNPLGGKPGESEGLKESKGGNFGDSRGRVLSAYPQDNVHGVDLPDVHGAELEGSHTSLRGQLEGASAVQRQTGKIKADI